MNRAITLTASSLRRYGAALASAIVPGVGQLVLGDRALGAILFSCYVALAVGYIVLRLPQSYIGLLAAIVVALILFPLSVVNALRATHVRHPKAPWLALLLFVPLSLLLAGIHSNVLFAAAGFKVFSNPSTSMNPALHVGDHIVADATPDGLKNVARHQIIIWHRDNQHFIKRVVALGGEMIEVREGKAIVNGVAIDEDYAKIEQLAFPSGFEWVYRFGPTEVPPGKFFVMGDNRSFSFDSRAPEVGFIDESEFAGIPLYVYASENDDRFGVEIR